MKCLPRNDTTFDAIVKKDLRQARLSHTEDLQRSKLWRLRFWKVVFMIVIVASAFFNLIFLIIFVFDISKRIAAVLNRKRYNLLPKYATVDI